MNSSPLDCWHERERVFGALDEAVRSGRVVHEVLPPKETPATEREVVFVGSRHVDINDQAKVSDSVVTAQHQLFGIPHLLNNHGITAPFIIEGENIGECHRPMNITLWDATVQGRVNLLSPRGQEILYNDGSQFHEVFRMLERTGNAITFCNLSSYRALSGAYHPETIAALRAWLDIHGGARNRFSNKYRPEQTGVSGQVVSRCQIIHRDAMDQLLINSRVWNPGEVEKDATAYIQAIDTLAPVNESREMELIEHFAATSETTVPLGWTGSGHLDQLTQKANARGWTAHVVRPTIESNELWRNVPNNTREIATLYLRLARECIAHNGERPDTDMNDLAKRALNGDADAVAALKKLGIHF